MCDPFKKFFFVGLTFLLIVFSSRAQDLDEISLVGSVTDEQGAAIAKASIVVLSETANIRRSVGTDSTGRYRLVEIPPGAYRMLVSADQFTTVEIKSISAVAGQTVTVDVMLKPAGVAFTQTVTGEQSAAKIDTTSVLVGGTLTRREIEALPSFTRAPLDLLFTFPGVTEEPFSVRELAEDRRLSGRETPEEAGVFALSGGQAYSNNLTINGLDNNDDRAARERFQPSMEAIEEVQVIANQFSAEYGRASGGRVNLRTRGGSRDFHARAFYFFGDESLNANPWMSNARGLKRLPLQKHDAGFTLSGPLAFPRKQYDRSLFFLSFEKNRVLDSALINTLVPVRSNPSFYLPPPTTLDGRRVELKGSEEIAPYVEKVRTPAVNDSLTARIDHTYSQSHNATLMYARGRYSNTRGFNGGSRLAESVPQRTRDSDALSYSDTLVLSPRAINQFRFQYSQLAPRTLAGEQAAQKPVVLIKIKDPLVPEDEVDHSGTLVAGSSTLGAFERRERRLQAQNTFTVVRGDYTYKFGVEAQKIRSAYVDLDDASGTFSFDSVTGFISNEPSRFQRSFGTSSTQTNLYSAFFIQHDWHRAKPALTFNFGLRYENETIIRDRNNWGPRVGVALDPFKSGKTVIRFGAGLFYNRALLRTIDDFTLGKQKRIFDTNALLDPLTGRTLTITERRAFIAANISFPQTLGADSPLVQTYSQSEQNFTRRRDPALRLPESYQFNLGFERELKGGVMVEVNYTRHRGAHLWREFNANAPQLPVGYKDLTSYLLSRDFANFRDARTRLRPVYGAASAGELIRFTLTPPEDATKLNAVIARTVEYGVPISVVQLDSIGSTAASDIALAALARLRPDPSRGAVEQLASIGNSFYDGLTISTSRRLRLQESSGLGFTFRAAYTFSHLIDDGSVNTSDALRVGDFRGERARSLLDRRHRFVLAGTFIAPRRAGGWVVSPVIRLASGAPFNISLGGDDRNLDDVGNDRPNFNGDVKLLHARKPSAPPLDPALLDRFRLPIIGQTGNLPRNAGRGPSFFLFDLNLTREFRFGRNKRTLLRPNIEIDNVLNHPSFSFGSEYINFAALAPQADEAKRQALFNQFLVPTRTSRPRSLRLGLRLER